jgi:hypothetical protein
MKISTSLKYFQENYYYDIHNLGSNWKNILNFWIFIDELSFDQWLEIEKNISGFSRYNSYIANISRDMNLYSNEIQLSTWILPYRKYHLSLYSPIYATYELIAMDKILEEERTLQFLPLFVNL